MPTENPTQDLQASSVVTLIIAKTGNASRVTCSKFDNMHVETMRVVQLSFALL